MRMLALVLAVLALSAFIGCQSKPMVGSDGQSGREGITVSGDWTVEVRNPDGSLATRKQFSNTFIGQHIVAGLLSYDLEPVIRTLFFTVTDSPVGGPTSDEANCKVSSNIPSYGSVLGGLGVLATAIHAPNDDGEMFNSVWNASCTLEINGDQPKFLTDVRTLMFTTYLQKYAGTETNYPNLSSKKLAEPIEVWDGQVVAATVILSVD